MLIYKILVLTILGNLAVFPVQAQNELSRINLNYKYDPEAEVLCKYKVAVAGNTATIFLRLSFNEDKGIVPQDYQISYDLRKGYDDNAPAVTEILNENNVIPTDENTNQYFRFQVPVIETATLVVLKVTNEALNQQFLFDIPVDLPLNFPKTSLVVMEKERDIPVFKDYVSHQDTFRIVSVNNEAPEAHLFLYSNSFSPADPPMAIRGGQVDRELNIDSTFTVNTGENLRINKKGLYFIQQDSTSLEGISLLVTDPYFPQLVKAETLVEPLIYISTGRENKRIKDAENKKKAMDTYWLDLTKSPERARNIIREYYRQVAEANYLFTNYKEGWKTDKGMIIQLFGKPDGVYLDGESEEWVYQRKGAMSRIKFNFVKVKNFFTDHHYELIRNPSYDREWYRTVDLWRKGRQEI